eukprot:261967_1
MRNRHYMRDKVCDPIWTCMRGDVAEEVTQGLPTIIPRKVVDNTHTTSIPQPLTTAIQLSVTKPTHEPQINSKKVSICIQNMDKEQSVESVEISGTRMIHHKEMTNINVPSVPIIPSIRIHGIVSQSDNTHIQHTPPAYLETPVHDEVD